MNFYFHQNKNIQFQSIKSIYRITVYLFILMLLIGCDTLSILENDDEESTELNAQESIANSDNDDYYLQIAKDLYVGRQYKQAYQIAIKLAEKDNHEAQYLLGYLVYYGQGIAANKQEGTKWIKKSADAGYRPAIEGLVMIRHGLTPDNKCETGTKSSNPVSDTMENSKQIIITPDGQREYLQKKAQ